MHVVRLSAAAPRQSVGLPHVPVQLRDSFPASSRPCMHGAMAQPIRQNMSLVVRAQTNKDAPWEVLGVDPGSSEKEIKAAHRKLVLEHHPDRAIGSTASPEKKATIQKRFMRIQEAYEMLMGRRHVHMGTQEAQNGWNFHDFFWSFNYHRRKKEGDRKCPPPPAGSWKGQMENLKRRAAARKWKKARQARQRTEGWFGNIMNMKERVDGDVNSSSGAEGHVQSKAVSNQLEGLKRKAHLKKTILNQNE